VFFVALIGSLYPDLHVSVFTYLFFYPICRDKPKIHEIAPC